MLNIGDSMKNLTNILGGIALFFAAFFILVLIPQFFNFGNLGNTLIGNIGLALVGSFGLTSAFIPVFFIAVGIISLSSFWTEKTGVLLVFSFIPFVTVVGIEHITTNLFSVNIPTMIFIRFISFFTVSALVVAIEYVVIGLVFDIITRKKIAPKSFYENFIKDLNVTDEDIESFKTIFTKEELEEVFAEETENKEFIITEDVPEEEIEDVSDTETASVTDEPVEDIIPEEKVENIEDYLDTYGILQVSEDEVNALLGDTEELNEEDLLVEEKPLTIEDAMNNLPESEKFEEVDEPEIEHISEDLDEPEVVEADFDAQDLEPQDLDVEGDDDLDVLEENDNQDFDDFDNIEDVETSEDLENIEDFENSEPVLIEEDISEIVAKTFGGAKEESIEKQAPSQIGKSYLIPSEGILKNYSDGEYWLIDDVTRQGGVVLEQTLSEFKIEAKVTGIRKGPVVTMYEMLPAPGVKLSKIVNLADNIALRLAAPSIRIVAPIPGKHAVGIEVPNKKRSIVGFKELIDMNMDEFEKMAVPVVLGKDISGEAQVIDLAKTPHLLIAGATGAGKSVCVNSLILSILYKRSFRDVKMILIDPKVVELKLYNDIPHLLTPVITEPKKAFQALQYCLCEMERRYALLDGMGVRDISNYNKRIKERGIATEKLPYIVLIIDEFADLMATTGKELESTVARLAAMSRAVGIHLVLATQRPSIDVITGLIKANIPSRIAFMVASKTDSRIIIDQVGADKLLGKGDMLYAGPVDPFPVRIQGTFVSDDEVEQVCNYVKQFGAPDYIDDEIFVDEEDGFEPSAFDGEDDPLYEQALEIVMQSGKASASYIQRRLKIGYNRAARLVEDMEARGIVGPANGSKPREVLHMV